MEEKDFLEDEREYLEEPAEESPYGDELYAEEVYDEESYYGEVYDEIPYPEEVYDEEGGDVSYPMDENAYMGGEDYGEEPLFYEDEYTGEGFREEETPEKPQKSLLKLFQKKEPQDKPAAQERPAHKGRPARKKGAGLWGIPHLLATLVWLLIIVAIGTSLGRMLWVCAADILAFGRESKEVTVTVTAEDSLEDIAAKLQDAGLVEYPELFLMYADLAKVEEKGKISTGTFTLNTVYDYMALVNAMSPSSSSRKVIEDVLIPEGYSCRQIFERLEEKNVCTVAELESYAASGELSEYWFLEGVERGDKYCLEGFLFPATYDFYENSSPRQVLEKMLNAFEANFTEELNAQIDTLNGRLAEMMRSNGYGDDYIAQNQMSLRDVVTVASMVEEETSSITEGYTIASVIYNRLTNQKEFPYLNIDATIIYALDGDTNLTAEKMAVDSPYNSYTNKGLIPGPITNPGLASIKAALEPESTSYYYYVFDESAGEHIFSKTYEEHQKNIANLGGQDG